MAKSETSKFCERLVLSRNNAGMTQHQLAAQIGVRRSTVGSWENPKWEDNYPNSINLENLAKTLRVDVSWLRFGFVHREDENFQPKDYINESQLNVLVHGSQPLSMKEIGEWLKLNRQLIKKGAKMSLVEKKKLTFPVEIDNDAMTSKDNLGKSLLIGDRVMVDAAFESLKSGDIVCARFGDGDNFKFRQYNIDGSEEILSALNEKYTNVMVDVGVQIVGVVTHVIREI